jgi:hypothetical protein
VFDAVTGQIDMNETRAFTYTRDLVIRFINERVIERGGYHPDIHDLLMRSVERDAGNPQLQDE